MKGAPQPLGLRLLYAFKVTFYALKQYSGFLFIMLKLCSINQPLYDYVAP